MKISLINKADRSGIEKTIKFSLLIPKVSVSFNPKFCLKAVNDTGKVMGVTAWKEIKSEVGFVLWTYVYPEFRRKGVMTELIKDRTEYMRNQGAKVIYTIVIWKYLLDYHQKVFGYKPTVTFPSEKGVGDLGYQQRMELKLC